MKILLLGNGGREHSLAWRLNQCESVEEIIVAGINPGISKEGIECVEIDTNDPASVLKLSKDRSIDLVVAGPEAPLVAGVADVLREVRRVVEECCRRCCCTGERR